VPAQCQPGSRGGLTADIWTSSTACHGHRSRTRLPTPMELEVLAWRENDAGCASTGARAEEMKTGRE